MKSVLWNFATIGVLPFLKNHKNADLCYNMDLDIGIVLEQKKTLSYNQRNMVDENLLRSNLSGQVR